MLSSAHETSAHGNYQRPSSDTPVVRPVAIGGALGALSCYLSGAMNIITFGENNYFFVIKCNFYSVGT